MAMQREQDLCTGRGFADTDANGWCAKLKTWIVKTAVNGGPGWYILKDKSTAPVAKTVSAVNTTTETITITAHGFLDGAPIKFQTSGSQIGGITTGTKYYCHVVDADNIRVFSSWQTWLQGSSPVNLSSAGSGNSAIAVGPYIIVSDQNNPSAISNAKILKIGYESSMAGYATVQMFLTVGASADSHPLGLWGGYPVKTVDAGAFTYDFRGNDEFLFLQSRIPAEAKWYRVGIDEFSILTDFTEDNSAVYGIVASNQAYTPGSAVTLTLQNSSQVDSLTKGNGYFVYYAGADVNGSRDTCTCVYGVISGKGATDGLLATQVSFTSLCGMYAPANTIQVGARITPYLHTYYSMSNFNVDTSYWQISDYNYSYSGTIRTSSIPYYSYIGSSGYALHQQSGYISAGFCGSIEESIINKGAQDDGYFIVQRPAIVENLNGASSGDSTNMNRTWGEAKNTYCTVSTGMTDMETGRTINGIDYVSMGLAPYLINNSGALNNIHLLLPHTESI